MTDKKNPTRREFLISTTAAAAAGVSGIAKGAQPPDQAENRDPYSGVLVPRTRPNDPPNILLFLCDEMRYPPVYEGQGLKDFRMQNLHLQAILRETGVEFHRHYAASTACAPSRTSIWTGHYPSLHGVTQTTGAAKEANDPDVYWLDPGTVPTMGDYFKAAGYRSLYRGKWHVSNADLQIPGTHDQIVSYTDQGDRDPEKETLYQQANRLSGYGFEGWIGPEPHGSKPLNTASSPSDGRLGRDQGFASQTVDLLRQLDADPDDTPFFLVSSFVNPHDISLWGYFSRHTDFFNFTVDDDVPHFEDLFDPVLIERTLADDLATKPSCQASYQESYHEWMQGIPPEDYWRFYYQLHKNVDAEMLKVYEALLDTRFFDSTIVVFTSDHGDLLGSHRYMHQKWYQTYDEALRVPLIISNPHFLPNNRSVHSVTSHVDLMPTLLGLAGINPADHLDQVAVGHSDAVMPVGRDLSELVRGRSEPVSDPIFFMTDDDPSRGLDQDNFYGIAYDSVIQPNHIESVIVEIGGAIWKLSRYFDNLQFWSDPEPTEGVPEDVVLKVEDGVIDEPGVHEVEATKRVKFEPEHEEWEMYDVTSDPMELENLYDDAAYAAIRAQLTQLLDQQRAQKRLRPISGDVPGQP